MATRKPKQPQQDKSLSDYARDVFHTVPGQLFLKELNRVYVQRSVFDVNSLIMAHAEGRRSLVIDFNFYLNNKMETDGNDDTDDSIDGI
jgi:hypothetical protein